MKKILVLAALAAAGCTTVGPDYQRPAFSLPNLFAGPAPAPADANEPRLATDWWKLFRDPALDALVADALERNADLRIAAARVEEAEGALREAGAAFFPDVAGGYGYTRNQVSRASVPAAARPFLRPQNQLLASTSYEVDFWGRLARSEEAARAGLLGSRHSRDVVALTLAGATAQGYFALRSLDVQSAVLLRSIQARGDSLALARARLEAGLASQLDVDQAQGALSDAQAQRREVERQRAVVERQLAQLAGRPELRLPPGDLFALPLAPVPPPGLPSSLLERRPDIRAAEQSLVAANAQIGVAKAALFPTISLTGALGAQSARLSQLLGAGAGIWTLGYGLALPLFDGGRRKARVEQAEARQKQALGNYQKAVETAFREVSEGLINVEQGAAAEGDLELRLKAARSSLELSTLRYESGYSPFLEVLDAQRTANDAELAFVRNRQARLAYGVDLMKALGGGWTAPGK